MIANRPIPPYHRRTAGTAKSLPQGARPGDKIARKTNWQLDKTDWRGDVLLLDSQPRSVPSSSKGVTIIDRLAASSLDRQTSMAVETGREIDLEALVESGRGKREKRATTAATLGYDFVSDAVITPIPDLEFPSAISGVRKGTSLSKGVYDGDKTPMGATPRTPTLLPASHVSVTSASSAEHEIDDEWERISAVSESHTTMSNADDDDDLGSVILLGEMELEESPCKAPSAAPTGMWGKKGVSYAAALARKA